MWVILHSALEEFHLREAMSGEMDESMVQALIRQVFEEALVGALRIAGLVSSSGAHSSFLVNISSTDKRFNLQWIFKTRSEYPSLLYLRCWNVPRTPRKARSQNLH